MKQQAYKAGSYDHNDFLRNADGIPDGARNAPRDIAPGYTVDTNDRSNVSKSNYSITSTGAADPGVDAYAGVRRFHNNFE